MSGRQAPLDVLIVGGGPGGTALACRGKELGLQTLVIDYDDLMKRIRDYSKDKLILPGFGGGDRMKFPAGGELVSELRFGPIDKDEMCSCWKEIYRRHGLEARLGVELTGLERRDDGTFTARVWDHGERCDGEIAARTVVLALGRGVPRRFDIPGNTDGVAFRLDDPAHFVGRPACVIGGGTSAAEAVIAVSNAKAAAADPSAVYWSYRGDRMPRVSRALAEVFFEAYVGNGNIRYYPKSEPAAVVTGEDREEYLAIRVDRRRMEGRPSETLQLEFPKDACIACIGEDLPEALLASIGIPMVTGGPSNRKRMAVSRCLETRLPGVFLVGDILSQAYLETDDFDADPAGFREVKHRGNIKSALRDGVLVAQVIRQKLDGKEELEVRLDEAEDLEEEAAPAAVAALARPVESAGPPRGSVEAERRVSEVEARLVRLLPTGVEENEYPVRRRGVTTLGRADCDVSLPDDSLLSPRHASISHGEEGYLLRDDGSATGVFLRLPAAGKIELSARDLLRLGRQFLMVSASDGTFGVVHFDRQGHEVGRHELTGRPVVLGRQAPDITLDAKDSTLSRRHLALSVEGGKLLAKDLKSVNGTFLRVRGALPLEDGARIRLGQQSFVFRVGEEAPAAEAPVRVPAAAPEAAAAPARGASAEAAVTFQGTGKTVPVAAGQTICDAAEQHGIQIVAECHSGICGSDPVRIHAGAENLLGPPDDQERETLEELCELEPGPCRLACKLKVKGPVEVEIL